MEDSEEKIVDDEPTLATLRQVEVPFLDALIMALLGVDGDIYVPVTPFATHLGIGNPRNQVARIKRDDTMAEGLRKMTVDTVGGKQEQQCIRLDMFAIWLITITEKMFDTPPAKIAGDSWFSLATRPSLSPDRSGGRQSPSVSLVQTTRPFPSARRYRSQDVRCEAHSLGQEEIASLSRRTTLLAQASFQGYQIA